MNDSAAEEAGDASELSDSSETPDASAEEVSIVCPPPSPNGFEAGERWTNLTFEDCEGNRFELHDLCGSVALVFNFYGW